MPLVLYDKQKPHSWLVKLANCYINLLSGVECNTAEYPIGIGRLNFSLREDPIA